MISFKTILSLSAVGLFASCSSVSLSPTPDAEIAIPGSYKFRTDLVGKYRSDWWVSFHDSMLNSLQKQLLKHNNELEIAFANYQAALGTVKVTRAEFFPRIDGTGSATRDRDSENANFPLGDNPYTTYELSAQLGYEIDLWGRVKQLVRQRNAEAKAAKYLLAEAQVSLHAQLARHYYALRFIDAEKAILQNAVRTRKESLRLAKDRVDAGIDSALDSARAKSLLATAQAESVALDAERARLENAIAVLIGKNPSSFSIKPRSRITQTPPKIPSGLPAELLTRRPDVAAAYAKLEASSAQLGVAKAAPYPKFRLTGSGGFSAISSDVFLKSTSRIFSVGPSVDFPLFAGGRLGGNIKRAKANQSADLARFQQTSLNAFAEVETALASIQALRRELNYRNTAAKATREAQEISNLRYQEGTDTYLSVIDNERERLTAERAAVRTQGQLYSATIQLIQALGGGFSSQ